MTLRTIMKGREGQEMLPVALALPLSAERVQSKQLRLFNSTSVGIRSVGAGFNNTGQNSEY